MQMFEDGQPGTPPRPVRSPHLRRSESPPPLALRRPPTAPSSMTPRTPRSRIPVPYFHDSPSSLCSTPRGSRCGTLRGTRTPYGATPRHSVIASPRTSVDGTPRELAAAVVPNGIKYEMDRMQSELTSAREALTVRDLELHTLKSKVRSAGKELGSKAATAETMEARALRAEQAYKTMAKELADTKKAKLKLESQYTASERKLDKLSAKVANAPAAPNVAVLKKDMQSEVTALKNASKKLESTVKAYEGVIRAKDKELARWQKQVEEREALRLRVGELENRVAFQEQEMEGVRAEGRAAQAAQRQRESEAREAERKRAEAAEEVERAQEKEAALRSELEQAYESMGRLDAELCANMEQLTRAEKVASRVTRFEQSDGLHGDGTVPFQYFLHETNYLKGEVARLRDQLRRRGGKRVSGGVEGDECATERSYWAPHDGADVAAEFNFEGSHFGPATLQRYAKDLNIIPIDVRAH